MCPQANGETRGVGGGATGMNNVYVYAKARSNKAWEERWM